MFQPDSFLIRFLTKTCDLLFLNIMFVLSCVTIVFSGAAVTSLYAVTLKMIRGQDYAPVKDFLRALSENFLPSFPAAILLLVDVTSTGNSSRGALRRNAAHAAGAVRSAGNYHHFFDSPAVLAVPSAGPL